MASLSFTIFYLNFFETFRVHNKICFNVENHAIYYALYKNFSLLKSIIMV